MSDEKELIKKRGSYKGRLTAFATYLNSLDISSLTQAEANELQLRVGKIESLYEQYDEVQLMLECMVDNMDLQISERNEFDSQYYKLLSKAQEYLVNFNKTVNSESKTEKGSSLGHHKLVKLPSIQLPKYNGSYDTWLEFRDTFYSLIHSNDDIDDVNKFHYLRASLEGSAAILIQSVEFSANNYAVVWKLLCERFDNKRLLLQNHVSALFNIEPVTKESSKSLKRLIDQVNKNLRALESLGEPVKYWDTLLIHILINKLDTKSYREWEEFKVRLDKDKPISFDLFISFIRSRADLIETLELSRSNNNSSNITHGQSNHSIKNTSKVKTMVSVQESNTIDTHKTCPKCNMNDHNLINCPQFLSLSSGARLQLLPSFKVCFNCFRSGHYANKCKKPGCKICKRRHNTLVHVSDHKLHQEGKVTESGTSLAPETGNRNLNIPVSLTASVTNSYQRDVLLSTALVKLYDKNNRIHIARALLDSGSSSCLMTERMCSKLNLPTNNVNISVLGINNSSANVGKTCRVNINSLNNDYSTSIQCFILPTITDNIPSRPLDLSNINIPSDICLADPLFHTPAAIDFIIGADVFWNILGPHKIMLSTGGPILFETRLGWLVSGPLNSGYVSSPSNAINCHFTALSDDDTCSLNEDLQNQLTRFWQLEEVCPKSSYYSPEEKLCEEHFIIYTKRSENGRFFVNIPFKLDPTVLGDSFQRAIKCFLSLERRLQKQPELKKMYIDFMSEYELLGHMTECEQNNDAQQAYYIPHHGVLRESSSTTKLRVVFNASSPSASGISLNDIQLIGPTVQDDLLSIILRFRQHRYVLTADVEKMYRQIYVHPENRHLQRIVWRSDPSLPLRTYQLNTVTYGTASAPYLATRCIKQIGLECEDEKIKDIILHDFYVDDLVTGADNFNEAVRIRQRVTAELNSACMNLRKWTSNAPQLMTETSQSTSSLSRKEPCKPLGLGWQPDVDEIYFSISPSHPTCNTKRDMLSVTAQIFDPLGLLAPCIISMKMLLQQLWLQKISWDDQLPVNIGKVWNEILRNLPYLNNIRVPRTVVTDSYKRLELHIFTDSSERAYGACAYVRSIDEDGTILVRLLLAKSRVAPIKVTTIPRLELCGALVGARLYEKIIDSLRVSIKCTTFWTDSTIVLGWLKMLPSKLQPFVRNRVAEILDKTGNCSWRHVPTNENPADFISRGVDAGLLQSLDLWWLGPTFLKQDESEWPSSPQCVQTLPEIRNDISLFSNVSSTFTNLIDIERYSKFLRLKRAVAYVLRFINLCKKVAVKEKFLTHSELNNALNVIIRLSQSESFPEYELLLKKQQLPKKSPLIKFNVFLDDKNIMRVGGRLHNSDFSYDKKHPILLQSTHRFTKLLFTFEHEKLLHAGPQLLLASIRETYWPIGGRTLAKACYHRCIRCNRLKGQTISPLMGNLPKTRVSPGGHLFNSVGVDYAGPLTAVSRQGRGCRHVKVYIAIFICLATKAVHLELVGDLTSNNYLLALRRFVSRRGKPSHIYSDNGTSFVGAYNDLSKFLKNNCTSLAESSANEEIKFHFIPAYTPHFGGVWESGVRSTKFHLVRVLGNCFLTYEELNTVLIQVEAILNSRPLTPISSDPDDFMPLTPGHFLIGRPFTSLPVQDYKDYSTNHLTRYQRIEQLRQHFWSRWSKEYVAELQQRTKWQFNHDSLKLNSLVLLKEDNLPPLKWRLGRIISIYPGSDGIARVADVKTANGVFRRSFSKICPLPICDEDEKILVERQASNARGHVGNSST